MKDDGSHSIQLADEQLLLLPERALWWPQQKALVLSDVHFGKSATFRANGIPVPEGESQEDLDRINRLLGRYPAQRLVIAGDFFHSPVPLISSLDALLREWLAGLTVEVILVRGNHDPACFQLIRSAESLAMGDLLFIHDPVAAPPDQACITGHVHPLCRIGKAGPRSRVPCFVQSGVCLTLPAFGTFTSGSIMQRDEKTLLFPVVAGKVHAF
ncbi:MAG: DEAD/DEAH box helicase [Roseibacillus sp.]|nr:DEAD/DEAH box helicase [Roseibacillus sp.]HAO95359.1 DEAD/DEAH box helicase [Verrucomicrobiales bacterium]